MTLEEAEWIYSVIESDEWLPGASVVAWDLNMKELA